MAARRAQQARASHLASSSNLASHPSGNSSKAAASTARLKSTSMTNLVIGGNSNNQTNGGAIQRPASRSALDNIHKGMNARFTHVQSKVLLQNIRPQQQGANRSASPAASGGGGGGTLKRLHAAGEKLQPAVGGGGGGSTLGRRTPATLTSNRTPASSVQSDRSQLMNRVKALQDELEAREQERDNLRRELERERADRAEQLGALKGELEAKALEAERQHEEYHQKLIEAYELADQNRRAADSVLGESRQREEELRKKIEELEGQLGELREFVAMKEEMMGKMGELREQIRVERERYEEKTRSLNQMFENEKISHQVEQSSNYFRRQKPALEQSLESINRLDGASCGQTMAQASGSVASCSDDRGHQNQNHYHHNDHHNRQPQQQQQQQQPHNQKQQQRHHQSEHDIYGSKLSTRMQDGARAAWKKSRKFASSVITGGLGGLSACRRHNISGKQKAAPGVAGQPAAALAPTMLHVHALPPEQQHYRSCSPSQILAESYGQQQEHTSVVEVGATVRDYISHQHQQQVTALVNDHQQQQQQQQDSREAICTQPEPSKHSEDIRVDENNKLTIVTKFNELVAGSGASHAQLASGGALSAGSERSRCESSSSGRGTSDSGSAGSQHEGAEQEHVEEFQQKHRRSSSLFKKAGNLESTFNQTSEPSGGGGGGGDHATGGLNKSLRSFFALAAASSAERQGHQMVNNNNNNNNNHDHKGGDDDKTSNDLNSNINSNQASSPTSKLASGQQQGKIALSGGERAFAAQDGSPSKANELAAS